jgi:PIN domain nuclease of toxin-antitoxin system
MAAIVHLDTHVVVWLYAGLLEKIPRKIQSLMNRSRLGVSPMAVLELDYLHEIGRLRVAADVVTDDLHHRIGLQVSAAGFPSVAAEARRQTWTRDPFDRIIAAQACVEGAGLITADEHMHNHVSHAVWE